MTAKVIDSHHAALLAAVKDMKGNSSRRSSRTSTQSGSSAALTDSLDSTDTQSLRLSITSSLDDFGFDTRALVQYHVGDSIEERYDVDMQCVARGGYGQVFKAEDRHCQNRFVAVKKILCMDDDTRAEFMKETKIMQQFDHPAICKLFEVYEKEDELFMVLEYLEGGELFDKISEGVLTNEQIPIILEQVARALKYAHNAGVAHRDLKPENVCFCDKTTSQVKVIDWGLSSEFTKGAMKSNVGSQTYAAPEVLAADHCTTYSKSCDLWSLGVLAYVMIRGKPPFWGSYKQQLAKMRSEEYPMREGGWGRVSVHAQDFVRRLLKADASVRMNIDEVLDHPFLHTKQRGDIYSAGLQPMFSSIVRFSEAPRFYALVMASVARRMDHTSMYHISQMFDMLDTDKDGTLQLSEMRAAFESTFGKESREAQDVDQVFNKVNIDGSGKISFTQFCAASMGTSASEQEQILWAAFRAFDRDSSGMISSEMIKEVLSQVNVHASLSEEASNVELAQVSREIVEAYDKTGDGRLDFVEFKCMMNTFAAMTRGAKSEVRGAPSSRPSTQRLCKDAWQEMKDRGAVDGVGTQSQPTRKRNSRRTWTTGISELARCLRPQFRSTVRE
jgi:calcium-dependent protein kinase